jgi:exopolysaccharide biosynthesis WecB/TagA/CpsF family protein
VTGIDLMFGMLERGHRAGYGIYLLGATEDILRLTARKISQNYPGVRVVGKRNGFFSDIEEKSVVQDIEQACPDILLIAMSSPHKERFLARWGKRLCVPICHGVGGAFDVMAGKVNRAPSAWQHMGLEWLYRLKQEPRRLFKRYFTTNTWFFIMLVSELIKRKKKRNPPDDKIANEIFNMIRLAVLTIVISGLTIYAFKDWYLSLCGLISLMSVLEHPEMPKMLFGIPGINLWNILLTVIVVNWALNRKRDHWAWDMPKWGWVALLVYFVIISLSFFRMTIGWDEYRQFATDVGIEPDVPV